MAATFTHPAPPGRVLGAPPGTLVCVWSLHPAGRLFGRWSPTASNLREPFPLARPA